MLYFLSYHLICSLRCFSFLRYTSRAFLSHAGPGQSLLLSPRVVKASCIRKSNRLRSRSALLPFPGPRAPSTPYSLPDPELLSFILLRPTDITLASSSAALASPACTIHAHARSTPCHSSCSTRSIFFLLSPPPVCKADVIGTDLHEVPQQARSCWLAIRDSRPRSSRFGMGEESRG